MGNLQYQEKRGAAGVRQWCGSGAAAVRRGCSMGVAGKRWACSGHVVINLWLEMVCTKECTIHHYKLLIFIELNSSFLSRGWGVSK